MKKLMSVFAVAMLLSVMASCNNDAVEPEDVTSQISSLPSEPLSADEVLSLTIMREEEKLAYDVYTTLYTKWGVTIFNNIAKSESTHTSSVLTLLNKYGLPDPVGTRAIGVFNDATLQALYNKLVLQGSVSQLEALKIGATVEDLDIFDLNAWLTKVDNQDVKLVFENLNKGSRNHLRSFYEQIKGANGVYSAQYLTQSQLDAIVNSPRETGSF